MGTTEQICLSLKKREIEHWKRLKKMYPQDTSKHDVLYWGILSLLNKNHLKRTKSWKNLKKYYPSESDWVLIRRVIEEHHSLTQ